MLNEKLQQLGLIQGVDYSLVGEVLTALPKIRKVIQESVEVDEVYYENVPSIDELKLLCILDNDPVFLISEYLKDKTVLDDDSVNVDLFLNNKDGWRFSQVVAPSVSQLFSLIDSTRQSIELQNTRNSKITAGKKARETCQKVLDLISGYNLERSLTLEQISQLQGLMQQPEMALRAGRPGLAKLLIAQVTPDGVLVTDEMQQAALDLLVEY